MKSAKTKRRNQLGQAMVEFTFVGIPVIFVLISIFEVSRGMWMYHTLAHSVKVGVRYAQVRGINCVNTPDNPNNCTKTIADVAQQIKDAGVGLDLVNTTLTFTPGDGGAASTTCNLNAVGGCSSLTTNPWPWYDATFAKLQDSVGQPIRIDVRTPFQNAIALFWPGSRPMAFGSYTLGASSQDFIQF